MSPFAHSGIPSVAVITARNPAAKLLSSLSPTTFWILGATAEFLSVLGRSVKVGWKRLCASNRLRMPIAYVPLTLLNARSSSSTV